MIKTFQAVFNQAKNKGVYGISLVEDPAMEGNFIALSKKVKIEFKAVDDEKRILVGMVLEPDKPIYRNQNGEEFNIIFSEKTITDLMYNFQKQGFQTNSSIEHSGSIDGVTFVEQWQVRDEKIDTAVALGLNPKKGSWIAVLKCDNDEIYDKAKSGEIKGFSIDAFVELEEIKLNKHSNMEEQKKFLDTVKDTIIKLLSDKKEEPKEVKVELGSVKSADGQMEFFYDGETPDAGMAVWMLGEDGETRIPVPVGSHELEGGGVLVVSEEGIIGAVEAKADENQEVLTDAPAVAPSQATAADVAAEIKSVLIKYTEDAKAERLEFEKDIKKQLEEMSGKLVEFSKEPASKVIKSVPTVVGNTSRERLTQFLNNRQ